MVSSCSRFASLGSVLFCLVFYSVGTGWIGFVLYFISLFGPVRSGSGWLQFFLCLFTWFCLVENGVISSLPPPPPSPFPTGVGLCSARAGGAAVGIPGFAAEQYRSQGQGKIRYSVEGFIQYVQSYYDKIVWQSVSHLSLELLRSKRAAFYANNMIYIYIYITDADAVTNAIASIFFYFFFRWNIYVDSKYSYLRKIQEKHVNIRWRFG